MTAIGVRDSFIEFQNNPNLCTAAMLLLDAIDVLNIVNTVRTSTPNAGDGSNSPDNGSPRPDDDNGTGRPDDDGTGRPPDEDGRPPDEDGPGQRCNSFSADTEITTTEGDLPIAEVEIGDMVYAYDPETGDVGEYSVTNTISHEDNVIAYLTIDGEEIETTPWHLFYTDEGWIEAEKLESGDKVLSLDGEHGIVEDLIIIDETQMMYDLTVAVVHTFAVGNGEWVVHNINCLNDPQYGGLDSLGRPTGASVTIDKSGLHTGSSASVDPPGYQSGLHHRGHLIANVLGGAGNDTRNIVSMFSRTNLSPMKIVENAVRRAVNQGQTVEYSVQVIYEGNMIVPTAFWVTAQGSGPNPLQFRELIFNSAFDVRDINVD